MTFSPQSIDFSWATPGNDGVVALNPAALDLAGFDCRPQRTLRLVAVGAVAEAAVSQVVSELYEASGYVAGWYMPEAEIAHTW